MNDLLDFLAKKNLIWRGKQNTPASHLEQSGYQSLDEHLKGGFPQRGVISINSPTGIGELRLLIPGMLEKKRLTVFINPPGHLNAEFLHHQGFDLNLVLLISTHKKNEALWSAEQCLKSGACSAVVLWQNFQEVHQVKRLQLACNTGNCVQFLLRTTQTHQQQNLFSLPVSLNINLRPHWQGLETTITKQKGGWPLKKFTIDMSSHWPYLSYQKANNVVAFPHTKAM